MARTLYFLAAFIVVEWSRRGHEHALVLTNVPKWVRWVGYAFRRALGGLAGPVGAAQLQATLQCTIVPVLPRRWLRWCIYTALIWITLDVGARATSQFIYFRF